MTYEEVVQTVAAEVAHIAASGPSITGTPIITGRLWSSIKYEQIGPTNWRVYIDEGDISLEEWESDPENPEKYPMGFAPYAEKVNNRNPYWTRMGVYSAHRIASSLGSIGKYDPNSRGE